MSIDKTYTGVPQASRLNMQELRNVGLSATADTGALTIALTQNDGATDPTSSAPSSIPIRGALTSGSYSIVDYTAATSVVIPDTATLGYANGDEAYVYVYAAYDGTNKDIAVSSVMQDETQLHTTTTISTGADSSGFYATTGRSSMRIKLLGRILVSAITTAGTWTAPDEVTLNQGQDLSRVGEVISAVSSAFLLTTSGYATTEYAQMTNNSVTLPPGRYNIKGSTQNSWTSSAPTWTYHQVNWCEANGANTSSAPTSVGTASTLLSGSLYALLNQVVSAAAGSYNVYAPLQSIDIEVTSTLSIYAVSRLQWTVPGDAYTKNYISATRLRDY